MLPSGRSFNSNKIYVLVVVYDSLGSFGTANVTLTVSGPSNSANVNDIITPITNFLNTFNNSGTPALTKLTNLRMALVQYAVMADASCSISCSNNGFCP